MCRYCSEWVNSQIARKGHRFKKFPELSELSVWVQVDGRWDGCRINGWAHSVAGLHCRRSDFVELCRIVSATQTSVLAVWDTTCS